MKPPPFISRSHGLLLAPTQVSNGGKAKHLYSTEIETRKKGERFIGENYTYSGGSDRRYYLLRGKRRCREKGKGKDVRRLFGKGGEELASHSLCTV